MLLALVLAAAPAAAGQGHGAVQPFVVQEPRQALEAPGFTLSDLAGRPVSLSEFAGKAVLLHFWASWCEPCKHEFPALAALAVKFRDKGLVVLAVAVDSRERAAAFLEERGGVPFPVVIDQWGSVKRSYGVGVMPMSVLVGRDGLTRGVLAGPREYDSRVALDFFDAFLLDVTDRKTSEKPAGTDK